MERISLADRATMLELPPRGRNTLRNVAETVAATKGAARKTQPAARNSESKRFTINQQPIGKPRMTQRDKWAKRPAVIRYRQWADEAREQIQHITLPGEPISLTIRAYFAMPQSWSNRKRVELAGKPHRSKPDWDNVAKAIQDIFWTNDQMVAEGHVQKFWDDGGGARVEVEVR